jgi:ribosomal protein bL25 (Ctc-form)
VSEVSITAVPRSDFGKGAARRTRREGNIPAVIYGEGSVVTHVALPAHELELALRKPRVVLNISFEGKTIITKPRDVQREPVKRFIEHVDLIIISAGEATDRGNEAVAFVEAAEAQAVQDAKDARSGSAAADAADAADAAAAAAAAPAE